MPIQELERLREQQDFLNEIVEIAALAVRTRLEHVGVSPHVLDELWVELSVRDNAHGNVRLVTADHDLATARRRETGRVAA